MRVTNRLLETARAGDILDSTATALMSICHRLKSPGKIVSRRHCLDQADLWARLWGLSNSFTEMGRPTLNRSRTFWGAEPYTVWERRKPAEQSHPADILGTFISLCFQLWVWYDWLLLAPAIMTSLQLWTVICNCKINPPAHWFFFVVVVGDLYGSNRLKPDHQAT